MQLTVIHRIANRVVEHLELCTPAIELRFEPVNTELAGAGMLFEWRGPVGAMANGYSTESALGAQTEQSNHPFYLCKVCHDTVNDAAQANAVFQFAFTAPHLF